MANTPKIVADGFEWIPRGGDLWTNYETATSYQGLTSANAMRNYVCRHELKTIQHGRNKLVAKSDLDRLAGLPEK